MDDQGFDRLARGLAGGTSRRLLLGSAVAGAATLAGTRLGLAKKKGKKKKKSACIPVSGFEGEAGKLKKKKGWYTATATQDPVVYGNLVLDVPDGTTFADLVSMKSDFIFDATSKCGAGAPRFVVFLKDGHCPYAQFPPSLCSTPGSTGNTGDLIRNQVPGVWNDELCNGIGATKTYADMLAVYADAEVDNVTLVTDYSSGDSTVSLKPCVTLA